MTVAPHSTRWTHRLNGESPASPNGQNNGSWDAVVAGSQTDNFWKIEGTGYNTIAPTTDNLTMVASLKYETIPNAGTVLFSLESLVSDVKVLSTGVSTSLKIKSGSDEKTISNLVLTDSFFFRLTLSGQVANFYPFDIKENETGESLVITTTSSTNTNSQNSFGCNDGTVLFGNLYFTDQGAFDADEFSPSIWTSNMLQQTGLRVVELLKNSSRMYLKTQVEPQSIVYAHDLSPKMMNRFEPPSIFVIIPNTRTMIESLGGGTVFHTYEVSVFVTTKAADYRFAHRLCAELSGEVVEEIYANSGESSNTDAIIEFNSEIDMRQEDEETICVNHHSFTFKRRINYRER